MKNKKYIILIICIIALFSMQFVSASDNTDIDVLADANDEGILLAPTETKHYADLKTVIDSANDGDEIILQYNYEYDSQGGSSDPKNGINITKNLIIDGNGATIDGKSMSSLFNISEGVTVTLKNLTIKNAAYKDGWSAADFVSHSAIYSKGTLNIENCTFESIKPAETWMEHIQNANGSVIYSTADVNILNSVFSDNCVATSSIIYTTGKVSVKGSTFEDNLAYGDDFKGAVIYTEGGIDLIDDCIFERNGKDGKGSGGVIYIANPDAVTSIKSSTFDFNYAITGGAIYTEGIIDTIEGSNFWGDMASIGAVVYAKAVNTIDNSYFDTCGYYTDTSKGAIYIMDDNAGIGYEGMRSFALATSKVSQDVLSYWLNKSNEYEPGLMKAAYGTFLTDLIVMYEHDCVADLAAEVFNVSWYRSSPAAFSLCNDYNCLYITGESNHDMGMSVNGSDNDVWKFRFTCSFAYSLIEQLVGSNIWQDYTIGSVTLGLLQSYMNNKSLELHYENGYYFLKVVGEDYSLLVLDPVTGIVRDIFSFNGLLGTMPCYHDEITNNAIKYGNSLLIINSSEFSQFNFLYFVSSGCSIIGSSLIVEWGTASSSIINPIGLSAICILIGFQLVSPFLAEISRNNSLYSIADFYDLDLPGKIESWIDYYFYQDGVIMDGINEFNTDFYIENNGQIELNKKQIEDIIKNAQKIANKLFIPFQIVMAGSSGGSKPNRSFYILSIISIYGVFSYYAFQLIKSSSIAKQNYLFKQYDLNQPYSNKNSIIINQTILGG